MGMYELLLILFVFGAVGAVAFPVAGVLSNASARRLRTRLDALADVQEVEHSTSAIRARYLRQLTPLERQLEQLPGMETLGRLCEQAGWTAPAYRVATVMLVLAGIAAIVAVVLTRNPLIVVGAAAVATLLPVLKARMDRTARVEKFDNQLPDALDLMSRSLRAGNPLMESFKFVSEEMKPPISTDFGHAWSNVNYGVSLKASLADLMERTPSVSLRSLATAILVQRETGGNLAEILDKITEVLRARAKFQRRLRTLTAEGRMSGWILGGLPFGLAALLSTVNPGYLPILFKDPAGRELVYGALALMGVGLVWISRIVKVRV